MTNLIVDDLTIAAASALAASDSDCCAIGRYTIWRYSRAELTESADVVVERSSAARAERSQMRTSIASGSFFAPSCPTRR